MSIILIESRAVHYEVLGRGRPLVFLHSWVGSWRYWVPIMQSASALYRTYAIDLWGFGDTAKNPERYKLDAQVELLYNFLDQMGILKIALVGHGLGATVGILFAWRYPEMVDRILLISLPLRASMVNNRLRSDSPTELCDWLLKRVPDFEPIRADALKADPVAIRSSLDDLANQELWENWKSIDIPCLQVYGNTDAAIVPPELEQHLLLSEKSHTITFEQSGHFPMLDETSKFSRLLTDFLSLPSDANPKQLQLKDEWKRRIR